MTVNSVEPPPEAFNFAAHLLLGNAGRANKTAFIDDLGAVTYGELDDRARRFAAALKERGVKREERALILMQDGVDWPVAFLGAMLAGVVPVAVNTLLTADDIAYMLEHSRAQAALVSGAVKPGLKAALAKSDHEVHTVVVSRPAQPLEAGEIEFGDFLAVASPLTKPARTHADDPAFWLYSSGSTGRPKGTVHSHANPYWTTELYGKAVLGLKESDVCFSAAKLFFAYGLGNALTFPLAVGATALLMAERPTPEAVFKRWLRRRRRHQADRVLWRADRLRRLARFEPAAETRGRRLKARVRPPGGAAGRDRRAVQAPFRRRYRRWHRLDRDAAHLHLESAGQGALRLDRLAGAGLRHRTPWRRRAARSRTASRATSTSTGLRRR